MQCLLAMCYTVTVICTHGPVGQALCFYELILLSLSKVAQILQNSRSHLKIVGEYV
jgi:hypothetical protein